MRRALTCAFAVTAIMAASAAGAQETKLPKQLRKLLAMTPEQHAQLVAIDDDDIELVATFDTRQSFQEKHGLLGVVWNDVFLRAFVDKKSGRTTFQVYFQFRGAAQSWPNLQTANYESPDGPKSASLSRLGSDVDCSSSRLLGSCTYTEVVAFDFDEAFARTLAASYRAGALEAWRIRFKGQSGMDIDEGVVAAEMGGLLIRVDQYRDEQRAKGTMEPEQPALPADLLTLRSTTPEVASSPGHVVSIADELSKLAGLRDDGILTDEEFEEQKAKLLGQ